MSVGTVINQGRFTSDGTSRVLSIRSDVDWMIVRNYTNSGATDDDSFKFEWQRGMANGSGIRYFKSGGGNTVNVTNLAAPNGFYLFNSSVPEVGARTPIVSIDAATPPEVTVASTAALQDGDVVRIENVTGGQQLGGVDFEIDVTSGTTFQLEYMNAIAAATTGWYRKIRFPSIWYPSFRFISNITQANEAVVTTTVRHNFAVGMRVRMVVPSIFGMTQMDGLMGTIVGTTPSTFILDIDSTGFSAFAWPTSATASSNYRYAQVFPLGVDLEIATIENTPDTDSAVRNISELGMILPAGANAPGGSLGDQIYWIAGTSYNVDNL